MIIDINLVDCIGKPHYSVICPPGCHLNSALPLMRKKYLKLLDTHMAKHQLLHKLDNLFLLAASPDTSKEKLLQALEIFDKVKMEGMKYAKHKCRHLNMGSLQFSPELLLWHKRRSLWQLVLCHQAGHNTSAHHINRLARSCEIVNPLGLTLHQVLLVYKMADDKYSSLKPKHELLRAEFLAS